MFHLVRLSRLIDTVNDRMARAVGWLTVVMVLIGAFNALARYIGTHIGMQLGSNTWLEAQWYLFAMVFMLGAAATLHHDKHVRVDVLYSRLSDRGKAWVDLLGTLLLLLPFCAVSGWACWEYVWNSWESREMSPDPGGLPRYPIKAVILLTFGMLFLQGISKVIKSMWILQGGSDEDPEEVSS